MTYFELSGETMVKTPLLDLDLTDKYTKFAYEVCSALIHNGHDAYFVGGCIRNKLIGAPIKDYDIVTTAKPHEIEGLFYASPFKTCNIGKAFGVITLMGFGGSIDVATARIDIGGNGRHPDGVEFTNNIEYDISRRDFTMNGICYNPVSGGTIDPYNGVEDIANKVIHFIGSARERINEDELRVLRAFRFKSQLGFYITDDSLDAIVRYAATPRNHFEKVSMERIQEEFTKILLGDYAFETIKLMADIGILEKIIPEIREYYYEHNNVYHTERMDDLQNISQTSIFAHVLYVLKYMKQLMTKRHDDKHKIFKVSLLLAALLHDIGKNKCREDKEDGHSRFLHHDVVSAEMAEEILTKMRYSNEITRITVDLIKRHMIMHDITKMSKVYKIRKLVASKNFDCLLTLGMADTMATAHKNGVPNEEAAEILLKTALNYTIQYGDELPDPIITGDTLISIGMKPGPDFKARLEKTYNFQLSGCEDFTKLLSHARGLVIK